MIDALTVLFSVVKRVRFCISGGAPDCDMQDIIYPESNIALSYAIDPETNEGNESVYTFDDNLIRVDSERSVTCDENGIPGQPWACQRYFPQPVLGPRWIKPDMIPIVSETPGKYGYCRGIDCFPSQPDPNTNIKHVFAIKSDGVNLWLDIHYYENGALTYSCGFLYQVNPAQLLQATDNLNGITSGPCPE